MATNPWQNTAKHEKLGYQLSTQHESTPKCRGRLTKRREALHGLSIVRTPPPSAPKSEPAHQPGKIPRLPRWGCAWSTGLRAP
eukprot:4259108-Prymnesium_polylepis.1